MQRRTWLKVGVGGAAVLAVLGVATVSWARPAWRGGRFSDEARQVARGIARAIIDGRLPSEPQARSRSLDAFVQRLEATVANFPAATQGEINQLFSILMTPPGRWALMNLRDDWQAADVRPMQAALEGLRRSKLAMQVQAYHALRDLTHGAYYADPSTWGDLGYAPSNPFDMKATQ